MKDWNTELGSYKANLRVIGRDELRGKYMKDVKQYETISFHVFSTQGDR